MNKDQIEGNWEQLKGKLKSSWGKLTDNDIALYNGNREQFFGKLQEAHGVAREEAEKQIKKMQDATPSPYDSKSRDDTKTRAA